MPTATDLGSISSVISGSDKGLGTTYGGVSIIAPQTYLLKDQGAWYYTPTTVVISLNAPHAKDQGNGSSGILNSSVYASAVLKNELNPPPDYYQMTGYDTVAATTITWYGRETTTPPPTQHPVINISAVKLVPKMAETDGTS
jgi:hypothetical protein